MASLCPVCTIKWVLIITHHIMARFRWSLKLGLGLSNRQQKLQCNARASSYLKFLTCSFNIFSKVCLPSSHNNINSPGESITCRHAQCTVWAQWTKMSRFSVFFCHGRPYHASAASGVAETTHRCKTQEWQQTLVWLESAVSKYH